jgi:hypothetical protein
MNYVMLLADDRNKTHSHLYKTYTLYIVIQQIVDIDDIFRSQC